VNRRYGSRSSLELERHAYGNQARKKRGRGDEHQDSRMTPVPEAGGDRSQHDGGDTRVRSPLQQCECIGEREDTEPVGRSCQSKENQTEQPDSACDLCEAHVSFGPADHLRQGYGGPP
jgi:hypothetical protein